MNCKIRVALAVIDGNDASGSQFSDQNYPSPAVHPAIQAVLEGLGSCENIECGVFFGSLRPAILMQENRLNMTFYAVPYRRIPGLCMGGALLGRFLAVRRAVRAWKPDIVHGQGTERESGLVAAFCGCPSVLTLHGNFRAIAKMFKARPGSYCWIAARLETLALRRIDHVICISEYVKDLVSSFQCGTTIIPNAVSDKFLGEPRPSRARVTRVVCMGTIDQRKNPLQILQSCEILWGSGAKFVLHVYGASTYGADYAEQFFTRLKPWEEQGVAKFEGFVKEPAPVLAAADVLVSASLEESFGMNLLEAMAVGTPCVASACGGMKGIVDDGQTGFLYPPGDAQACATGIQMLLDDAGLWARFSENSRRRAAQHFSSQRIAQNTIACYRSVMESKISD